MRHSLPRLAALATLIVFASQVGRADTVAFDTFDSSLNLISFSQTPAPGAFASAGDGFEVYQRGVSATIPFQLLDDTLSVFPADTIGIVDETKTDAFFGITDTVNDDNPTGDFLATWVFDVAGFTDLSLSIDFGAMGDFEAADVFLFEVAIDGGAFTTAFDLVADEAGSHTYTLASGATNTLNDPLTLGGVIVDNVFQTFTSAIAGTGNTLTLRLTGRTDGGSEALAFDNILVEGVTGSAVIPEPSSLALCAAGLAGLLVAARRRRAG